MSITYYRMITSDFFHYIALQERKQKVPVHCEILVGWDSFRLVKKGTSTIFLVLVIFWWKFLFQLWFSVDLVETYEDDFKMPRKQKVIVQVRTNHLGEAGKIIRIVCIVWANEIYYRLREHVHVCAGAPTSKSRTTNGPESFHSSFNKEFHHPHPSIYAVIVVLQSIQVDTHLSLIHISEPTRPY